MFKRGPTYGRFRSLFVQKLRNSLSEQFHFIGVNQFGECICPCIRFCKFWIQNEVKMDEFVAVEQNVGNFSLFVADILNLRLKIKKLGWM